MKTDPAARRRRRISFTLVEMLMVLVLLGILTSAVTVCLVGRKHGHALRAAAEDLAAAIRFAAARARGTNVPHRVVFGDRPKGYHVQVADRRDDSGFVPVAVRAGRERALPEGMAIALLGADGSPEPVLPEALAYGVNGEAFYGRLQLSDERGGTITIEVTCDGNQVRIIE